MGPASSFSSCSLTDLVSSWRWFQNLLVAFSSVMAPGLSPATWGSALGPPLTSFCAKMDFSRLMLLFVSLEKQALIISLFYHDLRIRMQSSVKRAPRHLSVSRSRSEYVGSHLISHREGGRCRAIWGPSFTCPAPQKTAPTLDSYLYPIWKFYNLFYPTLALIWARFSTRHLSMYIRIVL